jgi:hypothetical protein
MANRRTPLSAEPLGDVTMNWEAVGAVAEGIGAAGVIASLLYLAMQVRASARASAVDAKLQSTRLLNDFIDGLIQDPELNDVYLRGLADFDSLAKVDYYRFSNMAMKAFWFFSAGHFQYRMQTLSDSDWHELRAVLLYWISRPGCRSW